MNIITIDPSLTCTAIVINDKKFIYAKESYGNTKKGDLTKWFSICEPYITYRWVDYPSVKNYSLNEMSKLHQYDILTDKMINDILDNIDLKEESIVGMEGYSYNSSAGPLIDLVTLGTLLRKKLVNILKHVEIYPPSLLKLKACMLTYAPLQKGKRVIKYEYRNHQGIAGGKFQKPDIYKSLIENSNINCEWTNLLREYASDCLSAKAIPKPIEDMNDAKILYEIIKSSCNSSSVHIS